MRDHGLEAIRKSAEEITPGDITEYRIRTSATGTFSPTGLSTGFLVTTMTVGDTAIEIPSTPLTARNSLEIHNLSLTTTVFIGPDNAVTADRVNGSTSGKEVPANSVWNIDVTDAIVLWGICPTGESAQIKVMEIA